MSHCFKQPLFSKLRNDEMLFIELFKGEPLLMTKADFLQSDEWANYPTNIADISIAEHEILKFDLKSIIDQIGEDECEGWNELVWESIVDAPETKIFLKFIDEVFSNHPIYYSSKVILMDMFPTKIGGD